jgi:hypothetical protein
VRLEIDRPEFKLLLRDFRIDRAAFRIDVADVRLRSPDARAEREDCQGERLDPEGAGRKKDIEPGWRRFDIRFRNSGVFICVGRRRLPK